MTAVAAAVHIRMYMRISLNIIIVFYWKVNIVYIIIIILNLSIVASRSFVLFMLTEHVFYSSLSAQNGNNDQQPSTAADTIIEYNEYSHRTLASDYNRFCSNDRRRKITSPTGNYYCYLTIIDFLPHVNFYSPR
jgi:hypothetical protein